MTKALVMDATSAGRCLARAPWLTRPATRQLFGVLAAGGVTARVVGGAVRNTLLSLPVDDVDLATPARPETIMALCEAAGFKVVPTGLVHGTVTVVIDHSSYEITTLRRDVSTDGRRATVAFTDDWQADAERRDLTINALYCAADGTLFDPIGGLIDLSQRRVRFIGDADTRIREDYLRIWRFFRFGAAYGDGSIDAVGLAACARNGAGMAQLSGERVRAELLKLLVAPGVLPAIAAMHSHGLLVAILGQAVDLARLARLVAIEQALQRQPSAPLRLAALAVAAPADAERLATGLRLSRSERDVLEEAALAPVAMSDRERLYRLGRDRYERLTLMAWLVDTVAATDPLWAKRLTLPARWQPPDFPLDGKGLLTAGIAAGPALGERLRRAERHWIDHGFVGSRDDLLAFALADDSPKSSGHGS